jgi:hypothetical protein
MLPEFASFNVEIKKSGFSPYEGLSFPRTAVITFTSPDGYHRIVEEYGYLDQTELFEIISGGNPLRLDRCYIEKLSISEYRNLKGLAPKDMVPIKNFNAESAFFDNKLPIDLTYVEFEGGAISFENSYFAQSSLLMHRAHLTSGGINFGNAQLPHGLFDFTNVEIKHGDVNFKNAKFGTGRVDFQDAVIGEGDISFVNTDFGDGDVSFVNTHFGNGHVSFKVSRFGDGKVDFHYAKFLSGDISFEQAEFGNGRVDFRTTEFETGRVNFNRAVFGRGDVSFEASGIKKGKISFKKTIFGEGMLDFELAEYDEADVNFDRAVFSSGSISFYNARFRTLSMRSCHFDHYLDLRLARCERIDLSDTIARDIIDLKPYEFDLDIGIISFAGMRLIGRIYIDWELNGVKKLIREQEDTSKRVKAEQFRTLKENFNVTGQYSDEDKSYVEFKRLESEAQLEESIKGKPVSAIWQYPLYLFKLLVFDWAGLYATNPVRVMFSMLIMYTFFSVLFMVLTLFTSADVVSSLGDPDKLSLVAKSFYHSAITYLTIGYGDYYPSGSIRWLSSLEGFVGLFLMSYFTVAFVRKILR